MGRDRIRTNNLHAVGPIGKKYHVLRKSQQCFSKQLSFSGSVSRDLCFSWSFPYSIGLTSCFECDQVNFWTTSRLPHRSHLGRKIKKFSTTNLMYDARNKIDHRTINIRKTVVATSLFSMNFFTLCLSSSYIG
jgi:hypothetical protein